MASLMQHAAVGCSGSRALPQSPLIGNGAGVGYRVLRHESIGSMVLRKIAARDCRVLRQHINT